MSTAPRAVAHIPQLPAACGTERTTSSSLQSSAISSASAKPTRPPWSEEHASAKCSRATWRALVCRAPQPHVAAREYSDRQVWVLTRSSRTATQSCCAALACTECIGA